MIAATSLFQGMSLCVSQQFVRFGSINVTTKAGEKKAVAFEDDQSLFEALTNAGVMAKSGTCMGNMSCGKCKVKVLSGKFPAAEDEEKDVLGGADARLACAITCESGMDGAALKVL